MFGYKANAGLEVYILGVAMLAGCGADQAGHASHSSGVKATTVLNLPKSTSCGPGPGIS